MLSRERKRRFVEIGVFALPIVLLKITGLLVGGSSPAEADAATSGNGPASAAAGAAVADVTWTPAQIGVGEYVAQLRDEPFGGTPMRYAERAVVSSDPDPDPEPTEAPLEVEVTGIIEGSNGSVALLDGRPHRVGEPVGADGWHIVAIDVINRLVRFRNVLTKEETERRLPVPK